MKITRSGIFARVGVVAMFVALIAPLAADAASITSGTLTLSDSRPDQTSSYTFSGDGFSGGSIACIELKLSTGADGSGTISGLDTTGATLGTGMSGWTDASVAGSLRATRSAATLSGSQTFAWDDVVNGDTADVTYYGTFTAYTDSGCASGATDSTVVALIYKDGALVSLTVEPTLEFTITGLADATNIFGDIDTTLTSSATAIDFGNSVTSSANGISGQSLVVTTNAENGFAVYLRQSGDLTNGTHVIAPLSATNTSPSAFEAPGTEAWGYTTDDLNLGGGGTVARFLNGLSSNPQWAGMSNSNQLIMDNDGSESTQTTKIAQQLGISGATPSGNYSTTLVYTAAGSY